MEQVRTSRQNKEVESAIRVGLSVGVPLIAVYLADRLDLAVYAALGALVSLYGHREAVSQRIETQLVAACALVATIATAAFYAAWHVQAWMLAVLLALAVMGAGTLGVILKWVPRGDIFFVLVLLVVASIPTDGQKVGAAIAVGAISAMLSIALTLGFGRVGVSALPRAMARLRTRLSQGVADLGVRRHSLTMLVTTVAVLMAWLIANLLHIGHPFWAPIAVAAVMPAMGSASVRRRMAQLILGTTVGVALAAVLFSFSPGHVALITIIVLCQAVEELFVARHYGIALVFLAPLAIGMSNISTNLPWAPLVADRLLETGVGALVSLVAIPAGFWLLRK